ncbi:MAG: hypothetical protein JXA93_04300 [Anaerolineae bacterium]|nr:hypothetical protein [Anaerolineae bacterium]
MGRVHHFLACVLRRRSGHNGLHFSNASHRWPAWAGRLAATGTWAKALSARYGRRFELRHAVAMRFVRQMTAVVARLQRGSQTVRHLAPHVHLAIHQAISQALVRAAPVSGVLSTRKGTPARAAMASLGETRVFVRRETITLPGQERVLAAPAAESLATSPLRGVLPLQRVAPGAATRTVQVLAQPGQGMDHLVTTRSVQIVHRVTTARQRVEMPPPGRNVTLQTARTAVIATAAASATAAHPPQAKGVADGSYLAPGVEVEVEQGMLPVDVERLTDRVVQAIDRRILAHRERMGSLY